MPRRLLAVNVVLAGVSILCVALIVKQLTASRPAATPRARPPAAPTADSVAVGAEARLGAQAYNVIASRNLFSPTRTEGPATGVAGGAAVLAVKPSLHGVVLRDGAPIAYLEDPQTKRIAGYRIGDPIVGGTVQTISAEAVVIARPDGLVDVRLRDPSKPRPPAPPVAAQPPGAGQPPGAMVTPGAVPRTFTPPMGAVPQPVQPGQTVPPPVVQQPTPGPFPFARPGQPNLGRRLPSIPIPGQAGQPQPAPQR